MYLGANMLHSHQAGIRPEEKAQIFSGNLERMLKEVIWE